jgi:hypothetical protein
MVKSYSMCCQWLVSRLAGVESAWILATNEGIDVLGCVALDVFRGRGTAACMLPRAHDYWCVS